MRLNLCFRFAPVLCGSGSYTDPGKKKPNGERYLGTGTDTGTGPTVPVPTFVKRSSMKKNLTDFQIQSETFYRYVPKNNGKS